MIRVLIADDHPMIAAGIEAMLRETDYQIVRHVQDGGEVLAAIRADNPDIVILDERLPGMAGLDIFRALRAAGDARPVVLFTATLPERRAIDAIEAGVNGLVLKNTAPDQLLHCLDEVRHGRRWIEQHLLQRALDRATGKDMDGGPLAALTRRERAIVQLVGENLRNQEIAVRLGISEGTVKVHLHNAYEKLGFSSRVDVVLMMRDQGLSR
jgi:two-component system nitrate/nitrite response regulator NarP